MQSLEDEHVRQAKNRDAEDSWVRKNLYGSNEGTVGDDEMRQTVLGDLQTTTNVTNSESPLAKIALAAGLIATGFGLPLSAWILKDALIKPEPQKLTPVVTEQPDFTDTDTDTSIQLSLPDWKE